MTTDIIKAYEAVLLANQYESDSAQRQAIAALSDLAEALEAARSAKPIQCCFGARKSGLLFAVCIYGVGWVAAKRF